MHSLLGIIFEAFRASNLTRDTVAHPAVKTAGEEKRKECQNLITDGGTVHLYYIS